MTKPITPNEVKNQLIPPEAIEIWNRLICEKWDGHQAIILQKDAMKLLGKPEYLNIEHIYQNVGWNVEYDRPAFNKSYEPKFIFRA